MKLPIALGLICAAATSLAQVGDEAANAVRFAFGELATHRQLRIRINGTETIDRASMSIVGELYWSLSYDAAGLPNAKIEYTEWRDGILVQRTVGDGRALYNYAPRKNEYWVGSYGTHGPTPPPRYLANLMDDFTASLNGSLTYAGRLMRESFAVGGYRPWIPGGSQFLVTEASGVIRDPIVRDRNYVGTDTTEYAMFWLGTPAKRAVVFETELGGSTGRILKSFTFTETSKVGDKARMVDWKATIFPDVVPAADNFIFVPPAGARPIVGPRPNIG